jgi:GNAT superfamily N-acetyltransferase
VELDGEFAVRRATLNDAATLAEVGARLFAQSFAAQNTAENMRAYLASAFGEEKQRRELSDPANIIWLAETKDARAIGYAHVRLGSHTKVFVIESPAEVCRVYADQQWHGKGVGARLLTACVDTATEWGASQIWLGVWKVNPRAVAFYQKHGFQIVGEHTFQLGGDPQHDWVMVRDLAQE